MATVQGESAVLQHWRLQWRQEEGSLPRPLLCLFSQWSAWTGESAGCKIDGVMIDYSEERVQSEKHQPY